jgi:hypothetical protein
MILVVEGPSAAGKSTWVARWPERLVVPESGRVAPPASADRDERARFFIDLNCARWSLAVAAEHAAGMAICDSDPLKLHYGYCLARIGAASWESFWAAVAASRSAIACGHLGIADSIVCAIPDEATLVGRRQSDRSRSRRNFDLHLRLAPALADWYCALERLDPGRVTWELPDALPHPAVRARFDLGLFDEWMRTLPGVVAPGR